MLTLGLPAVCVCVCVCVCEYADGPFCKHTPLGRGDGRLWGETASEPFYAHAHMAGNTMASPS